MVERRTGHFEQFSLGMVAMNFNDQKQVRNFIASEVPGLKAGKLPPLHVKSLEFSSDHLIKRGGLLVVDVNAPMYRYFPSGGRERLQKPAVPPEMHKNWADLWIYDGYDMEFVLGGHLNRPQLNTDKNGNVDRRELLGDSITGGIDFVLDADHPALLIPRGIFHGHGTPYAPGRRHLGRNKKFAAALVFKLDEIDTKKAAEIRGVANASVLLHR